MNGLDRALRSYQELCDKVDAKFAEIRAKHASSFQCGKGCHGCCQPGLTVSAIERERIVQHLAADPRARARVAALAGEKPHGDARCALLEADGGCSIYPARPLICRSHGAPVAFTLSPGGPVERDVCPLNFQDKPLPDLALGHHIHLDTLNTILALLNEQATSGSGAPTSRTPLTAASLLK